MWDRRAKVVSVHDGDTFKAILDQGFGDTKEIDVRLQGVFAPELKQAGGADCRDFINVWLRDISFGDWPLIIQTVRLPRADHEDVTLGRYVCNVWKADQTRNLNVEVSAYIKAKGYGGGTGS